MGLKLIIYLWKFELKCFQLHFNNVSIKMHFSSLKTTITFQKTEKWLCDGSERYCLLSDDNESSENAVFALSDSLSNNNNNLYLLVMVCCSVGVLLMSIIFLWFLLEWLITDNWICECHLIEKYFLSFCNVREVSSRNIVFEWLKNNFCFVNTGHMDGAAVENVIQWVYS